MARFIAISGLQRSGKGTFASCLVRDFGFRTHKMAGPLKDMTAAMLRVVGYSEGTIHRAIEGDLKMVELPGLDGRTPRRVMQVIGSEFRMLFNPDVWRALFVAKVSRDLESGHNVCCDDIRFPEEMTMSRDMGALAYKVRRPEADRRALTDLTDLPAEVLAEVPHATPMSRVIANAMIAALGEHLGLPGDYREWSLDEWVAPMAILGNRSLWQLRAILENWNALCPRVTAQATLAHASEKEIEDAAFDAIIANDGPVEQFHGRIHDALALQGIYPLMRTPSAAA